MVKNVGSENVAVEDEDAGGAKTLAGDAIAPRGREPAGDDEAKAEHGADRDARGRRDEIVLEGILHEKHDPEEENEAADPGEELHSKKRLPIDWLPRRRRRRWWWFERRHFRGYRRG